MVGEARGVGRVHGRETAAGAGRWRGARLGSLARMSPENECRGGRLGGGSAWLSALDEFLLSGSLAVCLLSRK